MPWPRTHAPSRHLNDDGLWPRFHWQGLTLGADGALRLQGLPAFDGAAPTMPDASKAQPPVAGLAVDADGSVYISDPANDDICRLDGCFGGVEPAPCIGGHGTGDTQFDQPSGLAIAPRRHALYVADAGNGRVQIFDLDAMALSELLDGFVTPVSLAPDEEGRLYVVDTGTKRVELFTTSADRLPAFGDMVAASGHAGDPCAVACEGKRVYVLDGSTHALCVFSQDALVEVVATGIASASVFTVIDGAIYLGDPSRRRIAVWQRDQAGAYRYAGDAADYEGPVAALAPDGAGGLLVSPGGCVAPIRLRLDASHAAEGWLWSDAIVFDTLAHDWNRLHADIDLPAGTHVHFFAFTGARATPPPPPSSDGIFGAPWRAIGSDVTDFFIDLVGGSKQEALWLGARFVNDLRDTPVLSQARVDFDQTSYLMALPAIYRESGGGGNFLQRYLSLFESFFDEFEAKVDGLPGLLDPAAAPPDAVRWLAGFLALPLPEVQPEKTQREAIANAFARYARRGTVAGLRETLREEAGVRALIDEPLQAMGWWGLPAPSTSCKPGEAGTWTDGGDSILGFNTVLADAEPQGAVVGTTATFDRSQLIAQDEFGTPLFEAAAYRFRVRLYPGDLLCAGKLDEVRAIVEREKPAHTLYDLCVIESGVRVGYQAGLGIDTLLGGGPAEPGPLGDGALVLGGQPRARLGMDSRVGEGAQL
ncbi:phage tail protein [Variovorax ureilyticus]|uniref:phage tail protein n=1 Tax=Variovorax ureilyticus TaxID=1836198 RepID=UPI003D667FFA